VQAPSPCLRPPSPPAANPRDGVGCRCRGELEGGCPGELPVVGGRGRCLVLQKAEPWDQLLLLTFILAG